MCVDKMDVEKGDRSTGENLGNSPSKSGETAGHDSLESPLPEKLSPSTEVSAPAIEE